MPTRCLIPVSPNFSISLFRVVADTPFAGHRFDEHDEKSALANQPRVPPHIPHLSSWKLVRHHAHQGHQVDNLPPLRASMEIYLGWAGGHAAHHGGHGGESRRRPLRRRPGAVASRACGKSRAGAVRSFHQSSLPARRTDGTPLPARELSAAIFLPETFFH